MSRTASQAASSFVASQERRRERPWLRPKPKANYGFGPKADHELTPDGLRNREMARAQDAGTFVPSWVPDPNFVRSSSREAQIVEAVFRGSTSSLVVTSVNTAAQFVRIPSRRCACDAVTYSGICPHCHRPVSES